MSQSSTETLQTAESCTIRLIVNIQGTQSSAMGEVKVASLPRLGDLLDLSAFVSAENLAEFVTVTSITHPVFGAHEDIVSPPLVVASAKGNGQGEKLLSAFEDRGWERGENVSKSKGGPVIWG